MPGRPRRGTVTIAFILMLIGAATIMISPITSSTAAVALCGLALVVPSVAVVIWWLLRSS